MYLASHLRSNCPSWLSERHSCASGCRGRTCRCSPRSWRRPVGTSGTILCLWLCPVRRSYDPRRACGDKTRQGFTILVRQKSRARSIWQLFTIVHMTITFIHKSSALHIKHEKRDEITGPKASGPPCQASPHKSRRSGSSHLPLLPTFSLEPMSYACQKSKMGQN